MSLPRSIVAPRPPKLPSLSAVESKSNRRHRAAPARRHPFERTNLRRAPGNQRQSFRGTPRSLLPRGRPSIPTSADARAIGKVQAWRRTSSREINGVRHAAQLGRDRFRKPRGLARLISISLSDSPRQHPGGDRRPNDRVSPRGYAVDVIDPASRSRGAGDQTSIPASQQWARIHIARFGAGAGGGTDPHMGVEAVDPFDPAHCRRSKPRPPPARAARRTEIVVVPGDVVAVDCLLTHPHSCRITNPSCLAASLLLHKPCVKSTDVTWGNYFYVDPIW